MMNHQGPPDNQANWGLMGVCCFDNLDPRGCRKLHSWKGKKYQRMQTMQLTEKGKFRAAQTGQMFSIQDN